MKWCSLTEVRMIVNSISDVTWHLLGAYYVEDYCLLVSISVAIRVN